jgi:hypothetical protein
MMLGGVSGDTDNATASLVVPIRSEQARERRNKEESTGILDLGGESTDFRRIADQSHRVSQPLDGRPSDGDRSLESVDGLGLGRRAVANRGQETVSRGDYLVTRVEQHEGTGTIGVLS